jgi:hypothetical protein
VGVLDASGAFVDLAPRGVTGRTAFRGFDVRQVPFPEGPADLVLARLVLAHLLQTVAVDLGWAGQVRPSGLLLSDGIERIETTQPSFAAYLRLTTARVATTGAGPHAGPLLGPLRRAPGLAGVWARPLDHQVATCDAAAMFVTNLAAWGADGR